MFLILDELRIANWQRSKDGARNRNRPTRMSPLVTEKAPTIGGTDMPQDQVIAWLEAIGPQSIPPDDDAVTPAVSNPTESALTADADTWGVNT